MCSPHGVGMAAPVASAAAQPCPMVQQDSWACPAVSHARGRGWPRWPDNLGLYTGRCRSGWPGPALADPFVFGEDILLSAAYANSGSFTDGPTIRRSCSRRRAASCGASTTSATGGVAPTSARAPRSGSTSGARTTCATRPRACGCTRAAQSSRARAGSGTHRRCACRRTRTSSTSYATRRGSTPKKRSGPHACPLSTHGRPPMPENPEPTPGLEPGTPSLRVKCSTS
jgi:hypothetical protein